MKKNSFLLFFVFFPFLLIAQNVNIPDPNFKTCLVLNPFINTNQDSEIQLSEALAYTGSLSCSQQNINDLTGIEAFVNLTQLGCNDNNLTNLNLAQNVSLTFLACEKNKLTSLNVSNNCSLTKLFCSNNLLGNLNVSQLTQLNELRCSGNSLSILNLTQNLLLNELYCSSNNLNNLDITQNTSLVRLFCDNNPIANLNISNNINLWILQCNSNNLVSLDLSQNTKIGYLYCDSNNIQSINVSNLKDLYVLRCHRNNLNYLNLANGQNYKLTALIADLNPNLFCIQVDDTMYSIAAWTGGNFAFDNFANFDLHCWPTEADELELSAIIKIYPNPSNDFLFIEIQNNVEYQLIDMRGKLVDNGILYTGKNYLNTSKFESGNYVLKVIDKRGGQDIKKISIMTH